MERAKDERLLLLDEVVGGFAEEGPDEGDAGEAEGTGEQLAASLDGTRSPYPTVVMVTTQK